MGLGCKSPRHFAPIGLSGLLPLLWLLNPILVNASQAYPLQIKVLSAEHRALDTSTPVPKDCDLQNYSAYCNESKNPSVENVMVVQDAEGKSFTITCTVDSRFSKCAALPVGETFDARMDKHGLTVLYRNDKGKEAKSVYQIAENGAGPALPVAATATPQPKAAPVASRPNTVPANTPVAVSGAAQAGVGEKVKCNFSSTPPGAEITLDGKYVGSTPSEIAVSAGTHSVVYSMPGFAPWKRELTVLSESALTVNAILQKETQ